MPSALFRPTTGTIINTSGEKLSPIPNIVVAVALAATVAATFIGAFVMWPQASETLQVVVHDSTGAEHVFDLSTDQRAVIETDLGRNVIVVENGSAHIEDADCANGDCMRQHAISEPGQQLICLPHKLWVEVVPAGGEHGEMDVDAVETDDTATADLIAR